MQIKHSDDTDDVSIMCTDAYEHLDRKYKKQHRRDNSYTKLLAELIEIENLKNKVMH